MNNMGIENNMRHGGKDTERDAAGTGRGSGKDPLHSELKSENPQPCDKSGCKRLGTFSFWLCWSKRLQHLLI